VGAAGALAALAGLVVVFTGRSGPFEFAFEFALIVGLLAVVQGLRYGLERRGTTYGAYSVGDPEERYGAPPPGREFDESLSRTGGRTLRAVTGRRELRRRVRAAAATTLAATAGVSEAEAVRRIEEGTWTDDRVAARFLADGSMPLSASLRALVRGESRFALGVRHAVAAVAALETSPPAGTPGDDGRGSGGRSRASHAGRLGETLRERLARRDSHSRPDSDADYTSALAREDRDRPAGASAAHRASGRESTASANANGNGNAAGSGSESTARSATDGGGER
jgi:hypothetical protein